jgi:tRNA (guanosine-2'-O-)-methyltransferase
MAQLDGTGMKRLHREWRRRTAGRVALVLDSVQNPYNLGSIIRTAAAERVDMLWVAGGTTPAHAKVAKTALGTIRYVPWTEVHDGPTAITEARADGYQTVAIELTTDAIPLPELELASDVALVLGHEDRGVTSASLAICDATGFIPQLGKVGSLNVATAAAIAIYEVRRRSWTSDTRGDLTPGADRPRP